MRARLCLLLLAPILLAADWPRFRGPNGSGVADDPAALTSFGPGDVLHKIEVPGRGYSSPVISKGRLFLQTASDDSQERFMLCYDARTLKQLWSTPVPGGKGKTHTKNTLASSTPAADGEHVVGLFWDGNNISLHAFDYAGKERWSKPLGSFSSQHGAGQSPVLHNGRVYLNNDQDGKAEFMCFDAANGNKLWSVPRTAFRSCYSSPFIRTDAKGGTEIVIASTAGLAAYEPDSGKLRWQWEWTFETKPLRNVGSPVEGPGVIFAIAGDGDGSRHMVAVTPPGESSEPKLVWQKTRGTPYVPCPLVKGDYVYWVSDNGFAVCAEAKTGKIVFNERFADYGITASPILLNGHIVCVDERGNAYSFPAEPKFAKPRKVELGEPVLASPAFADGRLYIRGEKHLFVIGKPEAK
jgi:outer membrane protein assembly factor BamB